MTERKIILHIYGSVPQSVAFTVADTAVRKRGDHKDILMAFGDGNRIIVWVRVHKKSIRVDVGYEREMSMDKQKQIEGMAKILGNSCLWKQYGSLNCYDCKYYSQENHVCCSFGNKEAEMFYEAGYRKADDVIDHLMQAKDTSELTEKEIEFFVKHNEKVRKETAKEILDEVSKHYGGRWLVDLYEKYSLENKEC